MLKVHLENNTFGSLPDFVYSLTNLLALLTFGHIFLFQLRLFEMDTNGLTSISTKISNLKKVYWVFDMRTSFQGCS